MPMGQTKNGQSRETGNIRYTRHTMKKNQTETTTQYVLDTTMRKQTHRHVAPLGHIVLHWIQSVFTLTP